MGNSKILTVFAGVNGSGKSTFYWSNPKKEYGIRLNPDEILVKNEGDWKKISDQITSGIETIKLQNQMFEEGKSFNRETTLAGTEMFKTILQAKSYGYKIHLIYIGLESVELSKKRIQARVEKGGHGIENDIIERRYEKSFENLVEIYKLCDVLNIFDNSGSQFINIANIIDNKLYTTRHHCSWGDKVILQIKNDIEKDEFGSIDFSNLF